VKTKVASRRSTHRLRAQNLASRLCGEAKPGQILVSKRVLAMSEGLLEVESAGELALKGFHRPIPAFNVLGLKA